MLKLSANLSFQFKEVDFLDRFECAAKASFRYVEYMFPNDYPVNVIKDKLEQHQLKQNLMNLPAGN